MAKLTVDREQLWRCGWRLAAAGGRPWLVGQRRAGSEEGEKQRRGEAFHKAGPFDSCLSKRRRSLLVPSLPRPFCMSGLALSDAPRQISPLICAR
jgi:hypothetical protein